MFTNLLISVISATLILALAYLVVRPALRKRFFNTPGTVEQIWVDDQTSVLMLTKPFPWFATLGDFERHVHKKYKTDVTVQVLCFYNTTSRHEQVVCSCEPPSTNTKYDFEKLGLENCYVAVKSMAILKKQLTSEELITLINKARVLS